MPTYDFDSLLAQLERAFEQHDTKRAQALLAPLEPELDRDPRLAGLWLTMLRIAPQRPGIAEQVQRIIARWPDDFDLRLSACDALIRAAEQLGPDAPSGENGPAWEAARLAEDSLARLGPDDRAAAARGGYWLMNRANALRLCHRFDEAEAVYREALALDPNNGGWWFNFGLLHKARCAFEAGLDATQRAQALLGDQRGVLWNIALCATALGRGAIACEALGKLGFAARTLDSGMPHVDDLPPVQIRVATRGAGYGMSGPALEQGVAFELLWVSPASPCHGVVQTPTFREAAVDYGDLVLWDGVPIGFTERDGRKVPRFPLLAGLRAGDERRFRFVALEQQAGDVEAFARDLPGEVQLFAQQARVEQLCARCASGEHMHKHAHLPAEPHRLVYGKLIVPATVELPPFRAALDACLARHPSIQLVMPALYEALGDTRAAGKAHQLWRGLERTGMKQSAVAGPRA